MAKLTIDIAHVKVMRSHDYCHFAVELSATLDCPPGSAEWFAQVDDLRKNAARLADKAVEQYKVAKLSAEKLEDGLRGLSYAAELAERTPEDERTPEQKADIKALQDFRFNERRYNYQDDWNEEESE